MVENASISSRPRFVGWMLVHPQMGIMWSPPGSNAQQAWAQAWCWDAVEGNGLFGARFYLNADPGEVERWMDGMRSVGWRARRVNMEVSK